MKKYGVFLFLAGVGCASGVTREEHDALKKRYDDLETKAGAHNGKQASLYADLVDKHEQLSRRVNDLDSVVKILEATVKRLEEKLKNTSTSTDTNSRKGEDLKASDVATRVSETLIGLKTSKITVDEAIAQLKPVAKDASPLLVEELRRAVRDMARAGVYVNQLVAILSNFSPEAVRVPVTQALGEPGLIRIYAARIVGNLRDKETAKALEVHTATEDEDFRLVLGEALIQCRNAAGIPLLILCLSSKNFDTRVIAIDILRRLHQGEDLGYRATKPEDNAAAIRKWEEWYRSLGKSIFE